MTLSKRDLNEGTERIYHCNKGTSQGEPKLITRLTICAFLHSKCTQEMFSRFFVSAYVETYAKSQPDMFRRLDRKAIHATPTL